MQNTSGYIPLFPEQASSFAWQVDALYFYLILISVAFTIPIVIALTIWFWPTKRETRQHVALEKPP